MHETEKKKLEQRRRGALILAGRQYKVEALLITDPVDIRYLVGLTEGSQSALIGKDFSMVVSSKMYSDRAPQESPGSEVIISKKSPDEEIRRFLRGRKVRKIGYQEDLISLSRFRSLTRKVSARRLVGTRGLVSGYRAVKDAEEIRRTRRAVRIAEKSFRELLGRGASYFIGRTELELAAELEYRMRLNGADRQGFVLNGIIVGSGPNSAACHHFPTRRKVRDGEAVLFDWGAEVHGYRSDITRVVFIRSVPAVYREIYPVVLDALEAGMAAIRPGVQGGTIDRVSRSIIEEAGYGEEFRHSLGHGIGLQIHEEPRLVKDGKGRLRKNMIVTVEPGIYFDDRAGLRLEDDVLVTAAGHEVLTKTPRRMEQMILK